MKLTDNWFSAIAETESHKTIFVTGRDEIGEFMESGKFPERVEIYWSYEPDPNGMPSEATAELMESVQQVLQKTMEKDKLAILTGVYTGDSERTFVFYTRTSKVFGERLNDALEPFEMLPIKLYVEKDVEWNEYAEMCEIRPFAE